MDVLVLSSLFLFALLSSLLLAVGREARTNPAIQARTNSAIQKIPPGPAKLPVIGNLHQITGNLLHQSLWEISKQYGPFMHLKLGQVSAVVVSSSTLARDVLKTFDLACCSRPHNVATSELSYDGSDIAFMPYGERWRQLRKLCTVEFFSARKINSFMSVREDEIARMVKYISSSISSSLSVNVSELALCFSCNTTCRTAFGGDIAGDDLSIYDVLKEAQEMLASFFVADYFPLLGWVDVATGMKSRLRKSFLELDGIYQKFIDRHLDAKSGSGSEENEDLLDVLLRLRKDEQLTEENLKGVLMNVFIGGTDTSSAVVEWAMAELIRRPELMKRAQEEVRSCVGRSKGKVEESDLNQLHYLKCILKETMRLHPPVPLLINREIMHSVTLSDEYQIPPKTTIYVNAWAIGRDPDEWERPEVFDPDRFVNMVSPGVNSLAHYDFKLIPFGEGRRICPGKNLGMLMAEVALANLLYSFDWQLPPGMKEEDVSMEEAPGLTVHRKHALCLMAAKPEAN